MAEHRTQRTIAYAINTAAIFLLAILLFIFFNVEKHTPALASVNPFLNDPYDAIGTFGIQAALVFGAVALFRTFRMIHAASHAGVVTTDEQRLLLVRTQLAVDVTVVITILGDLVALARHTSVWLGSEAGYVLASLVAGFFIVALIVGAMITRVARGIVPPRLFSRRGLRATVVSLVALVALAVYPENLTQNTAFHGALLTVIFGALFLFIPLWAVVTTFAPYQTLNAPPSSVLGWLKQNGSVLAVVILVGMAAGLAVFAREGMVEGVSRDLTKVAHGALVYMGLEAAGVLIGFLCLSRPLRLFPHHGHAAHVV